MSSRWQMADVIAAQTRMAKPIVQSKYKNVKDGAYASKKEARRAAQLKLMEQAGEISNLREQVSIELIPTQRNESGMLLERSCVYRADFVYTEDGREVFEDSKGMKDRTYILKRKLCLFLKGIRIRET